MNKKILGLALPNIITNITVPLLGMVDMAIVGHLSTNHIGGITIGTGIFNMIYWCFGFLRMGTSGLTAQSYGARRFDESVRTLVRGISIALSIALLLIVLQWPISRIGQLVFNGSDTVMGLAMSYFFVRIWAAPATLGLFAIKGWFIGMQNSKLPMWIAIFINVVNILCSLLFVIVLHWGIEGVALGTVIAQYSGLALALYFALRYYGKVILRHLDIRGSLQLTALKGFFKVNSDIFLRTVCLVAVFTCITSFSGKISDEVLAIDALLLQFFTLFSYIMDGFAYAGESLVGRYIGAKDPTSLHKTIRQLILWGLATVVTFTALYATGDRWILSWFTDKEQLIEATHQYLPWVLAIPICGFSAFLFDGIYVGATASRQMRNSMFVATACFFAIYYYQWMNLESMKGIATDTEYNNALWLAFMVFLTMRGIMQALLLRKAVYSQIPPADA